ncbi:hypothetical protein C8Q74DRAFT_147390 [Fomes fomentarius]|nr:hypothetical protein C8Q74DRAFT_147390 [Fomes fomentarius]
MVWLQKTLWEVNSMLRGALNLRQPLFSIPTEILFEIVREVPVLSDWRAWKLEPFYYPALEDSTLLVPLSRTCRRLRTIALSHSSWWAHLSSRDETCVPLLLSESKGESLTAIVKGFGTGVAYQTTQEHHTRVAPRLRELHVLDVDYGYVEPLFSSLRKCELPNLESLTFCTAKVHHPRWQDQRIELMGKRFPRLRHLTMRGIAFRARPNQGLVLTHLVLCDIRVTRLHERVAALMAASPLLENIVLSSLELPGLENHPLPDIPHPPKLSRLRRVYFRNLKYKLFRFFLNTTRCGAINSALQVIHDSDSPDDYPSTDFDTLLSKWYNPIHMIELSVVPANGESHQFTLTATTAKRAIRLSFKKFAQTSHYSEPAVWFERILTANLSALRTVRELWISAAFVAQTDWLTQCCVNAGAVFNALPNVHTVVLVTIDSRAHAPDLSPLPIVAGSSSFDFSHLKTLRLVQCIAPNRRRLDIYAAKQERQMLKLGLMLEQLASGMYCYFEELVLQMTPHFETDPSEVARLGDYFPYVWVEQIAEAPRMPLPECCVSPDDGPGGSCTWTTSHLR